MVARLGLGTVQFGLNYGISNRNGRPLPEAVAAILDRARGSGIDILDTAALYGDSESVLGSQRLDGFRVVTKTPQMANPTELREGLLRSLDRLRLGRVHGLLVHRAADLLGSDGDAIAAAFGSAKAEGLVEKVGVSVYEADEIDRLLDRYQIDIIQLPINILDQRLIVSGSLDRLHAAGVEVHARSVLLQGLLTMPPASLPAYFEPVKGLLRTLHARAEAAGISPLAAALGFVRDLKAVDVVLVGVTSLAELDGILAAFALHPGIDASGLACHDPAYVNPAKWPK